MQRRIPSMDGLRAVGIVCVIAAHVIHSRIPGYVRYGIYAQGQLALSVFFFISGYLITRQLFSGARAGGIDLRTYYVRRFFRVVPPFYVFLATIGVLGIIDWRNIVTAGTFTYGYSPWTYNGFIGHTWTLSVEEQFYLLWPLVLVLAGRRRAMRLAVLLVAAAPLFRIAHYLLASDMKWMAEKVLYARVDALMSGCLVALVETSTYFSALTSRLLKPAIVTTTALMLILVSPALNYKLGNLYWLSVGMTIETMGIPIMVMYLVRNPDTPFAQFLNWRPVVHIGLISYSVYLWQQLFVMYPDVVVFGPTVDHIVRRFPGNVLAAFIVGEVSYRTIEAWSQLVRRSLERRTQPPVLAAAAGD